MFLFKKWLEALSFFKGSSLLLMSFSVFNNLRRSIYIFVDKFWWFLLFYFGVFFYESCSEEWLGGVFSLLFLYFACFFIVVLITRSSVEIKDFRYFKKYFPKMIPFIFFALFWEFVLTLTAYFLLYKGTIVKVPDFFDLMDILFNEEFFTSLVHILLFLHLLTLSMFFYLDLNLHSRAKSFLWSIINTVKLIVYYFPFYLFVFAILLGIYYLNYRVWFFFNAAEKVNFVFFSGLFFVRLINIFFQVSFLYVLYVRIKHSSYTLFYKNKALME